MSITAPVIYNATDCKETISFHPDLQLLLYSLNSKASSKNLTLFLKMNFPSYWLTSYSDILRPYLR